MKLADITTAQLKKSIPAAWLLLGVNSVALTILIVGAVHLGRGEDDVPSLVAFFIGSNTVLTAFNAYCAWRLKREYSRRDK